MPPEIPLKIFRGKTFEFGYLYAEDELLYLPILDMTSRAPVRLRVDGHGIPDGWPVRIECVKSPEELNTAQGCHYRARVVDEDTIEINALNAQCWKPFTQSGLVVLAKPTDLDGWHARAQVRDRVGGTVLFSWHSDPDEDPDGEIVIDPERGAIVLTMTPSVSADLPWRQGVYDLEAISPDGDVYPITSVSPVVVLDEVTA